MKDEIERLTLVELANLYKVDKRTFKNKWIEPIIDQVGDPVGYFYSPKQIRIIFDAHGTPLKYQNAK